ncbi:MAG: AAA family ATPase [Thermodesulfobacteriota bacterium]
MAYLPIRAFLDWLFGECGYKLIGHYDILDGLEFSSQEQLREYSRMVTEIEESSIPNASAAYGVPGRDATVSSASEDPSISSRADQTFVKTVYSANSIEFQETFHRIRSIWNRKNCPPMAIVIHFSERLIGSPQQLDLNDRSHLILLEKLLAEARIVNGLPQLLVIVTDDLRKLPESLYYDQPRCRRLLIPKPDLDQRRLFLELIRTSFYLNENEPLSETVLQQLIENLTAASEGLTFYELQSLSTLSRKLQISLTDSSRLIKRYKFGRQTSPWDQLSRDKLTATPWKRIRIDCNGSVQSVETTTLPFQDCLRQRVLGQDQAIQALEDMLIRNIEGMNEPNPNRQGTKPRGIFLFAGPTGVGKTELIKAFAEWMFGDESNMVRFDMSEFNQEHSDQKLIGAPPGYVGHEQGGQLTESVKKKPFCVILFDEVDKMHRKIWDIFLQILDDGRLTDGLGDTVYFSETVIVMTSNLGGAAHPVGGSAEEVEMHYRRSVQDFFRQTLGRPEILNRIGMDNVIVFHPIEDSIRRQIVQMKLANFQVLCEGRHGINIRFDTSLIDFLLNHPEGFSINGARGVESLLLTHLVNPVARYLFYHPSLKGSEKTVHVSVNRSTHPVETMFSE